MISFVEDLIGHSAALGLSCRQLAIAGNEALAILRAHLRTRRVKYLVSVHERDGNRTGASSDTQTCLYSQPHYMSVPILRITGDYFQLPNSLARRTYLENETLETSQAFRISRTWQNNASI
jgi:hypothetical protein